MGDLAETLLLTPQAAVQLVDRLTKAGFAERRPSQEDRRVVWLCLTRQGDELIDALAERHLEELRRREPAFRRSLNQLRRLVD
jgi:DNA-binding MarR family transcriptional regulator